MENKATKKLRELTAVLFCAFFCLTSLAQTEKKEKTAQQKQDEQGAALKKWFDEGDIVIEGYVEDWKPSSSKNNSGETQAALCIKVKINRILKGSVNIGYINIKTSGRSNEYVPENTTPEKRIFPENWGSSIYYSPQSAFLIKIKKSETQTGECFKTENDGIYFETGQAKTLYIMNGMVNKPFDNSVSIYQMLDKYCNVKIDLAEIQKEKNKRQTVLDSIEVAEYLKHAPKLTEEQKKKYEEGKAKVLQQKKQNQMKKDSANAINDLKKKINNISVNNATGCTELYISEYICGQGNNKAIEIYNPTSAAINLTNYSLLIYHGSSYTPTTIALTGTISALSTYVVSKPNASSAILAHTNQTSNNLNFNGDECIVLNKLSSHIDKIGEIGIAIGSGGWTLTPTGSTDNSDLRRKYTISIGDTNWINCKTEWDVFSKDSVSNLGQHVNICGVDPDLNITFANPQVIGGNFEFDIMVSSTGSSTYLNNVYVDLMYGILPFGTHIVSSSNITVTRGTNFNTSTYITPSLGDEGIDSMYIFFATNPSQTSWNRHLVTSTPEQLFHVSMVIANCNHAANIQFIYQGIDASSDNYSGGQFDDPNTTAPITYDTAYYTGSLTTFIPPCSSNPQITGFTGGLSANSVAAGAADNNTGGSESLLTINGSGFGSLRPTVYMKNAVDNNNPQYIPLDPYDLQTWSDTQITLFVPSAMFPPDTAYYPGTGFVYVKPNGATDSAISSTMVQVPYSLLNKAFRSGSVGTNKVRVPFAYRQYLSTTSFSADTSAYDFRFDVTTVTNNTQPNGGINCRALLKQVIEDWACKIPIKYRIGRDTTITNPNADGISYITFNPTLSNPSFGAETNVRVNGSCSTGHVYATEADITFNSTVNWYYVSPSLVPNNTPNPNMQGTPYADFFTTALHELGHASLLLHVNQTNDLMYFHIPSTSGTGPYISSDDYAGASNNLNWSKTVTIGNCPFNPFTIPASGATTCVDPETGQVGIEQFSANTQLLVYPNPAAGFINVTFNKQTESSNTIKLIDAIGQTVFYSNIGKNEGAQEVINLQSIAKGVYLLIVTDNENTLTKKIIVE